MSDVVERAKAALEGVTEGPWDAFWGDQCCGGTCVDNGHGLPLHFSPRRGSTVWTSKPKSSVSKGK